MADITQVVALDIGGTKIASALVSFEEGKKPQVSLYEKVPTGAEQGGKHTLQVALDSAQRVIDAASDQIAGIGVSSGGVIDPKTGDVTYANEMMPGWGGTHLGQELRNRFNLPARVMNDVHAHAFGEAMWGAGSGKEYSLVCAVGTGIGGAFVDHGHILLGAHSQAGHIGHVACTDAKGTPCNCGAIGHLEPIACGPGIISYYEELAGDKAMPNADGKTISEAADRGDQAAIEAEHRSGHALGEVLGSQVNMFDPNCVILSGSVAKSGRVWHDALKEGWAETVMPPVANTPIMQGTLGDNAPLIGAAQNVLRSAYIDIQ